MSMKSALCRIDLEDEEANYTIGQLVTHLKLAADFSDYEKVEKLLRRREERIKEEARREMEEVVGRFEGRYEEVVKWKLMVEESLLKFEEDVRVLRKQKSVVDECVRVPQLLGSKGKLRLGEVKVEAPEGFEKIGNAKSNLVEENVRLQNKVRECMEMVSALQKGAEVEKLRAVEMERLKKKAENDLQVVENRLKQLKEDNVKLINNVKEWRVRNEDMRKREVEAKVRVSELETRLENEAGLRMRAEKDHVALERKFQDLADENLKLRKDVAEWRKTDEDLRKKEQDLKIRVWELEIEVETDENLRRWAEEALEALERKFQELEMRISATDTDANMSVAGTAELVYFRKGKVRRRTSPTEAGGSSKRVNLVNLTEGAHLDDLQAGNFMEGIISAIFHLSYFKIF